MPYFTGPGPTGPNPSAVSLEDFPSSASGAFSAAAQSTWGDNPSTLAYDWARLSYLNAGQRMDKASAQAAAKAAGVSLEVPDDGYTAGALDLLIQRKHDQARVADMLDRAPAGWLPNSTRFAAHLAAGLADPLNIAATFVPVVGEARATSMLANAGDSLLARTAVRAQIGAAEGAVGMAPVAAAGYYLHQQLHDDYSMSQALLDVGFGAGLGATLHGAGGALGDLMRHGPHPALRFRGLDPEEVGQVLNFDRERVDMPAADQARALEGFTPGARRALGEPEVAAAAAVHEAPPAGQPQAFTLADRSAPPAAADVVAQLPPEIHETAMRAAIADLTQGRLPDVDAIVSLQGTDRGSNVLGTSQPTTLADVRTAALRQQSPESVHLVDFGASAAATERLAAAREPTERLAAAQGSLDQVNQRVQALARNLEQGGVPPEATQAALAMLKPWDDALADASNLGAAARAAALCGLRA